MKKLSTAQQNVIDKMANGWQLGASMTMDGRTWLQKGGCGKGGPSEKVHASTRLALFSKGLIEVDERQFPTQTYRLV